MNNPTNEIVVQINSQAKYRFYLCDEHVAWLPLVKYYDDLTQKEEPSALP